MKETNEQKLERLRKIPSRWLAKSMIEHFRRRAEVSRSEARQRVVYLGSLVKHK